MERFVLEQLSDFGDFSGEGDLGDLLRSRGDLADVRVSPDGHHIHLLLRRPAPGLLTWDRHDGPQQPLSLTPTVPIVDALYLESVLALVYESGKVDFWRFQRAPGPGWTLLHSSDLCNSPRARVVSVCVCARSLVWCEERPPSESSPVLTTRNTLRFCVCRRDFQVDEGGVALRGVKMALHNNPRFSVVSSGEYVHLLPDAGPGAPSAVSKLIMSWSPRADTVRLSSTCRSVPLKEDTLSRDSDFKRLLLDCLGFLSAQEPPEVCGSAPTGCGGLLLLLSSGWVCFLQKDGALRRVHHLDRPVDGAAPQCSLSLYQDTLAVLTEHSLHLIDFSSGAPLWKVRVQHVGVLFQNQAERSAPHFISEEGVFVVHREKETKLKSCGARVQPGALLIEAVFEEACTYYQQRSLSGARLTVDALKRGGRFQAPIALASILRAYLSSGHRGGAQNGVHNGDDSVAGQDKLSVSLEPELKALVALEEVKGRLVKGGVAEVEALCDGLVQKEVSRLLSSPELSRDALLYLNSIFRLFPGQSWGAVQATLQLQSNGEGRLSSSAPHHVWKTVLSPGPGLPKDTPRTNGELRPVNGHGRLKLPAVPVVPAVLPVFELLCRSVLHFQPSWFPSFLELSQQQQGSAGLALTLASGWGADGGDGNVPLYKRALSVVSAEPGHSQDLEVEVLLVSGRPNAVLQALRILMGQRRWERVTRVAQTFCRQSPLLNKEIFSTLLCEVTQHRELDPYLELLWALCPEDMTVTHILNMVLKHLPSSPGTSSPFPSPCPAPPAPFASAHSSQLTIGLLRPLLRKVLERETRSNQGYVDILQSPSYPPPTPPRPAPEVGTPPQPAPKPGRDPQPAPEPGRDPLPAPEPGTDRSMEPEQSGLGAT